MDVAEVNRLANSILVEKYCVQDMCVNVTEIKDNGRDDIPIYHGDDRIEYCQGRHMGFTIECTLIDKEYKYDMTIHCVVVDRSISRQLFGQLLAEGITGSIANYITTRDCYYVSNVIRLSVQQIARQPIRWNDYLTSRSVKELVSAPNPIKELVSTPESFNELGERKLDI